MTAAFAATLVDEWARAGLADAVVAPGSRSSPLALALARDGRLRVHVVLDERSAAFRALGLGLATGRPAVVVCTSGTAAAELHPAVVEAHHARVPLLVATADRPPELRGAGAGQTIDQDRLYGTAVRWFCDPGPPEAGPESGRYWRSVAARAVAETFGPPPGPVHLNLPLREPLVPAAPPELPPGRARGRPWITSRPAVRRADGATVDELAAAARAARRGLLVAGWGSGVGAATATRLGSVTGWPVVADAISGLRAPPHAVSTYEALARCPGFLADHCPDLVLRVGAPLTSKAVNAWLDNLDPGVPQVLVDSDGGWLDPGRRSSLRIAADADPLLDALASTLDGTALDAAWSESWLRAEGRARAALDRVLDADDVPSEARVARDIAAALPDGSSLLVASSLPVRALEWAMAPRAGLRVLANRGANGIDGFVSTVIGVAAGAAGAVPGGRGPTVGLLGDLCFLHDVNGLAGPGGTAGAGPDAVLVVLDNNGGGIFSFLPQAALAEHEVLFATPHGLDLVEVARAHGVAARRVARAGEVPEAVMKASAAGGVQVVVVPVPRELGPARYAALWDAIRSAV